MTDPVEPQLPGDEDPTMTANALKAMAHPLRWKILCTLGDRELSVGEIVDQTRDATILVFKKRRRQNSKRSRGHRQHHTLVRITEIVAGGNAPAASE